MRSGVLKKLGVGTVLVAFVFTTSGCFGPFPLTRRVWQFNENVSDNKWIEELVFLGLNIVPVYSIAAFLDALIINAIYFWTGESPIEVTQAPTTKVVEKGDTRLVQTMSATPKSKTMVVEEYHKGELVKTVVTTHEAGQPSVTTEVRYPDGRVETHVITRQQDGSATIGSVDDEGRLTTRVVSAVEMKGVSDRLAAIAAAAGATEVASLATRGW